MSATLFVPAPYRPPSCLTLVRVALNPVAPACDMNENGPRDRAIFVKISGVAPSILVGRRASYPSRSGLSIPFGLQVKQARVYAIQLYQFRVASQLDYLAR
jgi:hypothetical protein